MLKKIILLSLFLVVYVSIVFSYESGDFRAKKSGYWFDKKMWEKYENGAWHNTLSNPSGIYCNIYIPSGKEVFISRQGEFQNEINIEKKLIIERNAKLYSSPFQEYATINLYGDIEVNGSLGINFCAYEFDWTTILNIEGNKPVNRIYGTGKMFIGWMNIYNNCTISNYSKIGETKIKNGVTLELNNNLKILETAYVDVPYAKFIVNTNVILRKEIYVGGGNNFDQAASLIVEKNGNLKIYQTDNHKNICLGLNGRYASLIVNGCPDNYAKITGFDGSFWNIYYEQNDHTSGGKVKIDFNYARFENMKKEGLLIRKNVHVKNNRILNCKFINTEDTYRACLVAIEGPKQLVFRNVTFQAINPRFKYNIKYFDSSNGNVGVINYSGNIAGETHDNDPYNVVHWYNSNKNDPNNGNFLITDINATNYPNPFNPETTIKYMLPTENQVQITIFNNKGQFIKNLLNKEQSKGTHTITWDGTDINSNKVSSGIYIYKIKTREKTITRKMILLK